MNLPIYLDNASTTPLLPEVITAMNEVMTDDFGNPSSIHAKGRKSKSLIEASRKTVANIINASVGEIFFTSSATEANNGMISSAIKSLDIKKIITTKAEHPCVLNTIGSHDIDTVYLKLNDQGEIDIKELEKHLSDSDSTVLVSLMYVNNEIGVIHPIRKIAELCKEHRAYFHCDAVQAIGKYSLDVQKTPIHFLSSSAHKFHGPKGVGFMYINGDAKIEPYLYGGAQERNMRAGTENLYGIVGMAKALELASNERESRMSHIASLKAKLLEEVKSNLQDVRINASDANTASHIASISFPASEKSDLLMFNLDINGICASAGSACSSGVEHDSPVLEAIGHDPKRKTVRFSFSHLNTEVEIDYLIQKLKSLSPTIS